MKSVKGNNSQNSNMAKVLAFSEDTSNGGAGNAVRIK